MKLDPPVAQLGSPGDKAVLVTDWPSLPLAPFWPGAPGYGRNPLRAIAIVTTAALVSLAYQHAWDWLPTTSIASRQCSDLHLPGSRGRVWLGSRCDATCRAVIWFSRIAVSFSTFSNWAAGPLPCVKVHGGHATRHPAAKFPEGQSS